MVKNRPSCREVAPLIQNVLELCGGEYRQDSQEVQDKEKPKINPDNPVHPVENENEIRTTIGFYRTPGDSINCSNRKSKNAVSP